MLLMSVGACAEQAARKGRGGKFAPAVTEQDGAIVIDGDDDEPAAESSSTKATAEEPRVVRCPAGEET